jgi:(E)-benzylidenesuccinyl-CoA hydratase
MSLSAAAQAVVQEHALERAETRNDAILVARRQHVGVVLLDRPEVGNAHNRAMIRALAETWLEFDDDPDVRCMVMGSTNPRYFCTGIDLKEVAESRFGDGRTMRGTGLKPMVTAVEGMVVGGGLHWVVEADIVVASEQATFRDTHVNVGFVGNRENLGVALKAGLGAALYLSLVGSSAVLDARRGLELGLVQEVVPARATLSRALELADTISRNSPSAMANELRTLWAFARMHYDDAVEFGWELLVKQQQHPDSVEGPRAFAERRDAQWHANRTR